MAFKIPFAVANPSEYVRTDYVEVDLKSLGVPDHLDKTSLKLSRLHDDNHKIEIPFQIDSLLSTGSEQRVICFLSENTPRGQDDYSTPSARFLLEEGIPQDFQPSPRLYLEHFYKSPEQGDGEYGENRLWHPNRDIDILKFYNKHLEFAFCLVPSPRFPTRVDYTGCATSVRLAHADRAGKREMLCPFGDREEKRWGQLTQLVFFSLPWELKWFHTIPLLDKKYTVVWSQAGPVRAIASIRSEPIHLSFDGSPYIDRAVEITCFLYRVIYVYPEWPFYIEELFVLSDRGVPLGFRAYYKSVVWFPPSVVRREARFEHIPDYFAVWRDWADQYHGYGFAADSHVRGFEVHDNDIDWRLQLTFRKRCIHYFMFTYNPKPIDELNEVGHCAWYERAYKPLERIPLNKPYYPSS